MSTADEVSSLTFFKGSGQWPYPMSHDLDLSAASTSLFPSSPLPVSSFSSFNLGSDHCLLLFSSPKCVLASSL